MADDLGFGDVGFYGLRDDVLTPTIDRLAAEGVILRHFFAHPMCMPSRGAFITGRYPWSWGMTREPRFFNIPPMTFLQQSFLNNGYNTSIIGKWDILVRHDARSPTFAGFRHFWHHSSHAHFNATVHTNHGTIKVADLITSSGDEAISFIRHQDPFSPFFLWFTPLTPHAPFHAHADYVAQFEHVDDPQTKLYLALIKAFDDQIGRILKALEENGRKDDTLIVFLSDNGGVANPAVNNGMYKGAKILAYDGGIRVPALIHFPSKISPGVIRDSLIIEDLFETLHAAAGLPLPSDNQVPYRRNFWPLLIGPKDPLPSLPSRELALERHENKRDLVQDLSCYMAGMRKGRYKMVIETFDCNITGTIREASTLPYHQLVTESQYEVSIYDTYEDPGETANLLPSLKGSEIERNLWELYQPQAQALNQTFRKYNFHPKIKEHIANLYCINLNILGRQFQKERKYRFGFSAANLKVVGDESHFECNPFSQAVKRLAPAAYWPFQNELGGHHDESGNKNFIIGQLKLIPLPRKGFPKNTAASFTNVPAPSVQLFFPRNFAIELVFLLYFDAVELLPFRLLDLVDATPLLTVRLTNENEIVMETTSLLKTPKNALKRRTLNHLVINFSQGQKSSSLISLFFNGQQILTGELLTPFLESKLLLNFGKKFELLDELVIYHTALSLETIQAHHLSLFTPCSSGPPSLPEIPTPSPPPFPASSAPYSVPSLPHPDLDSRAAAEFGLMVGVLVLLAFLALWRRGGKK